MLTTLHKTQLQLLKDLNIKPDPLNLIEEKVGNSLDHIGTGEDFLNRPSLAQTLRSKFNKLDLMELKGFYMAKDTIIQTM